MQQRAFLDSQLSCVNQRIFKKAFNCLCQLIFITATMWCSFVKYCMRFVVTVRGGLKWNSSEFVDMKHARELLI